MTTSSETISSTNISQYVLEPCELPSSINTDKLRQYVKDYMLPREKFYIETRRAFYVEDEFSEWWTAKASDGFAIGKGNGATDVVTPCKKGVDAMCVVMNSTQTNEKSVMQNFKVSGDGLDSLFKNKQDTEAINLFMSDLKKKLHDVCTKYVLHDLYILAYITLNNSIYVCCFKYNLDLIATVTSEGFTKQGKSIILSKFIDKKFGNVKLYKSKKRIELRLSMSCITENKFVVKIY